MKGLRGLLVVLGLDGAVDEGKSGGLGAIDVVEGEAVFLVGLQLQRVADVGDQLLLEFLGGEEVAVGIAADRVVVVDGVEVGIVAHAVEAGVGVELLGGFLEVEILYFGLYAFVKRLFLAPRQQEGGRCH